jgi:glycosyltransferase involved in cell wall biosynthesis
MSTDPLVSVVTPVYNGGDYLVECIESILGQTYENWDYAIVDNASTDSTPEIAARYAAKDSRIRHLRHEDFVDATANHNRAFESISEESEFCKMVQGDDWLFPECVERMLMAASVSETVGVIGAYQLHGAQVELTGLPYETTYAPGKDILRRSLLGGFNVTGPPTATMLRSSFVRARRPFWQGGFRSEDEEAVFWMLSRHDFAFVHQVLTFCRQQSGSRWEWSDRMNTHGAESITFLLRYGPGALGEAEYQARLRGLLGSYVWWHIRQFPRLSRLRDPEFFELHSVKRAQILAEANGDPLVARAMTTVGLLLSREALAGRRGASVFPDTGGGS